MFSGITRSRTKRATLRDARLSPRATQDREALWPGQDPSQSTVSLNSLVYSLQRHLRADLQDENEPVLLYTNGRYTLDTDAGVTTDIARFDAAYRYGTRLAEVGDDAAVATLQRAVELYRGDLCAGPSIYAIIERERLRVNYLSVLAWLATNAYQRGMMSRPWTTRSGCWRLNRAAKMRTAWSCASTSAAASALRLCASTGCAPRSCSLNLT